MNANDITAGDCYMCMEAGKPSWVCKALRARGGMWEVENMTNGLRCHVPASQLRLLTLAEWAEYQGRPLRAAEKPMPASAEASGAPRLVVCLALVAAAARLVGETAEELGKMICEARANLPQRGK